MKTSATILMTAITLVGEMIMIFLIIMLTPCWSGNDGSRGGDSGYALVEYDSSKGR